MGSAVVNFLFQIVALAIVLVFTGVIPDYHTVAFPLVCLEMFLFSFGLGMVLAVSDPADENLSLIGPYTDMPSGYVVR